MKLASFEVAVEKTIRESRFIPEELALKGRISLSKNEVSQMIGELYMQKSSVNLMYDIIDAPDFFWDFDNLRAIYQKCRRMVDIDQRVEIVNMRLDVVRELLEILRVELSEQHGTRLEVCIPCHAYSIVAIWNIFTIREYVSCGFILYFSLVLEFSKIYRYAVFAFL